MSATISRRPSASASPATNTPASPTACRRGGRNGDWIPTRQLLVAFNEIAEPIFSQIHNLERQNQKLRTVRDLLLPRLMSGEIEVG